MAASSMAFRTFVTVRLLPPPPSFRTMAVVLLAAAAAAGGGCVFLVNTVGADAGNVADLDIIAESAARSRCVDFDVGFDADAAAAAADAAAAAAGVKAAAGPPLERIVCRRGTGTCARPRLWARYPLNASRGSHIPFANRAVPRRPQTANGVHELRQSRWL